MGLLRVRRRAMAHRLEVTTEAQARSTQPFLPLSTLGLASRAMAAGEPGSTAGSLPVCLSVHLLQWSPAPKCLDLVSPHPRGCHTCSHDGQGQEFPFVPGHGPAKEVWMGLCPELGQWFQLGSALLG